MLKTIATKFLSILTSAALLVPSLAGSSGAIGGPAVPEFVRALTPPSRLGFLDTYYQGQSKHPVILIEDLHANYGVQKKILGILQHLQSKIASGSQPLTIGVEAASGDIDLSFIRKEDPRVREVMGEFLLKQAAITGGEQFAALSPDPVHLVGIDTPEDYLLHHDLFTKSLGARLDLAHKIDSLHRLIDQSKTKAPRALKKIWKTEAAFHAGNMDLPELAQDLGTSETHNYGEAEDLLYKRKLEISDQYPDKTFYLKNLISADQDLDLLSRLLRQQMTLEEVQFVSKKLPEIIVVLEALLPGGPIKEWKDTIQAAIDYYAVALLRDKSLGENTCKLAHNNPDRSIVAVAGGFHAAGIAQILKERHLSYVVLAPVVESHTTRDEILYLERMLELPLDDRGVALDTKSPIVSPTLAARTYFTSLKKATIERYIPAFRRSVFGGKEAVAIPIPARERDLLPVPLQAYRTFRWGEQRASQAASVVRRVFTEGATYAGLPAIDVNELINTSRFDDSEVRLYDLDEEAGTYTTRPYDRRHVSYLLQKHLPVIIRRSFDRKGLEIIPFIDFSKDSATNIAQRGSVIGQDGYVVRSQGPDGAALDRAVDRALSAIGLREIDNQFKANGIDRVYIRLHGGIDAPELTHMDPRTGVMSIYINPRLLEPGFENALLGALLKGLVNVTTQAGAGETKELKTTPKLFGRWVAAVGFTAVIRALDTLGEGAIPLKRLLWLTVSRINRDRSKKGLSRLAYERLPKQGRLITDYLSDEIGQLLIVGTLHRIEEKYKKESKGRSFLYDEEGNERDLFPVPMGSSGVNGPASKDGISAVMRMVNLTRDATTTAARKIHAAMSTITVGLLPHHNSDKQKRLADIRQRYFNLSA